MKQRRQTNDTDWRQFYGRWSVLASAVGCGTAVLVLIGSTGAGVSRAVAAAVVAAFGLIALTVLYAGGAGLRDRHRPADLVTAIRAAAVCAILGWLALRAAGSIPVPSGGHWGVLLVLALAETTDLFDGYLARRFGASRFGAVWDMENDAFFIFALSAMAHLWFGLGGWVLIVGVFRYAYFLAFRFTEEPPHVPRRYKTFAKWVCAYLAIALIATSAPILPHTGKVLLGIAAVLLQTVSFVWDLRLQLRHSARG